MASRAWNLPQAFRGNRGWRFSHERGAYGSEMKNVLVDAVLLTKDGAVIRRTGEELELGYRTSNIPTEGLTVLEAEFRLQPGDKTEILRVMNDLAGKRREKRRWNIQVREALLNGRKAILAKTDR